MKLRSVGSILIGLLLLPLCGLAQSDSQYWILSYRGTATSSGDKKLATRKVTENDFIRDCATNSGVSTDNLALVLHFNANELGDTLEVVNVNDPNLFRCEVFKLAYTFEGSSPQTYTNSAGTVMKRFAYIYSSDGGHSRGSIIIDRRASRKRGHSPTITGKLQYWLGTWDENVSDPNAIVCAGTFKAVKPLDLP
ncbi:MAG TPA: hypothetical protein VIV82_00425 [Verrucomicrobiae bacterium]